MGRHWRTAHKIGGGLRDRAFTIWAFTGVSLLFIVFVVLVAVAATGPDPNAPPGPVNDTQAAAWEKARGH